MPNLLKLIRRHRRASALIGLLIIAVGGYAWWKHSSAETTTKPYSLQAATTGHVEETVTAQGTLEPKQYVNVGAQVSGQLLKFHADVGTDVSQSQLVAEIDPRVYESRLDESSAQVKSLQAQLAEQQAQLVLAQQQHGRNTQLVEAQAISKDAFDTSAAALKAAEARVKSLGAQIEQAKSTLNEAKTNLSYTKIFAPISGTVISQTAVEGQTLNANQTAPTVLELANLNIMTVRAQVAEADIGKITDGMPLNFTTLGGDTVWKTTVKQVIPSPQVVNDVVLYNVLADVDNPERKLMSGMSTQMNFVVGEAKDTVLIPVNALGKKMGAEDPAKGTPYQVFVPQGESVVAKTVHIGLMDRTQAQVLDGLSAGDQVAVPTTSGASLEGLAGKGKTGGKTGNRRAMMGRI